MTSNEQESYAFMAVALILAVLLTMICFRAASCVEAVGVDRSTRKQTSYGEAGK